MNYELILKKSVVFFVLALMGLKLVSCEKADESVRFGMITDLHFAHRANLNTRHYEESMQKTEIAIKEFKKHNLDFVIELGDLKDMSAQNKREETISFLTEIEACLQSYGAPFYHVLGNHDMDNISKQDFLSHITNPGEANGKSYYSFVKKGIKFIVLDANYNADQSDYDAGNFDWEVALIPDIEMEWLAEELKRGDEPVIIFCHQLLDSENQLYKGLFVQNAGEVNKLLVASKRVLAVFQGHHHAGSYSVQNGIHYFTLKGMIEGPLSENNSYALVEVLPNGDILVDGFANCPDQVLRRISTK